MGLGFSGASMVARVGAAWCGGPVELLIVAVGAVDRFCLLWLKDLTAMSSPVPPASTPTPGIGDPSMNSAVAEHHAQTPQPPVGGVPFPWLDGARAGDAVEVWLGGMLRHRGALEEIALRLGVVWIREWGTGMRIMLDLTQTDLRPSITPRSDRH